MEMHITVLELFWSNRGITMSRSHFSEAVWMIQITEKHILLWHALLTMGKKDLAFRHYIKFSWGWNEDLADRVYEKISKYKKWTTEQSPPVHLPWYLNKTRTVIKLTVRDLLVSELKIKTIFMLSWK